MSIWTLNPYQVYEASAVAVLFYHNVYEEGRQGGLEMLQRGVRVAGNGNLRLGPAPDQWDVLPKKGERQVGAAGDLSVEGVYEAAGLGYPVRLAPAGEGLVLRVDVDGALPRDLAGRAGFNLELMPGAFMGKSFFMDGQAGIFPRQFNSGMRPGVGGELEPGELARGKRLTLTPEAPATRIDIVALERELVLLDGRACAQNGWFVVRGLVREAGGENALAWRITPGVTPGWTREPVIAYSQVGYHPGQRKVAAIELDAHTAEPGEARLVRIDLAGERVVLAKILDLWGEYLCYRYAQFDFSEAREPGLYRLEYEGVRGEPFPIAAEVYQRDVWQPTLEQYLPQQMCHVAVWDVYRLWHGACHLDDAQQAPLQHQHFDSYVQRDSTETPFQPGEHIPGLDVGGWHDAGDYDLAAGSQAHTTHVLALAREAFGVDSDQTTVRQAERLVRMHAPDGVPDIVEQAAHGALNLLSGYRACGHSFIGIIEGSLAQYTQLSETSLITDNQVSADDRWAFTHRHTTLEYQVSAALAAASRVLRGWEDALAQECLEWAQKAWSYEQSHDPQVAPNCYVGPRNDLAEVLAAVELLITTGEEAYRARVLALEERILANLPAVGWAAARALPYLRDQGFRARLGVGLRGYAAEVKAEAARNPFGVPYSDETWRKHAPVWGVGWNFLEQAVDFYYLQREFPDLFSPDLITAVVGYILGCPPGSNHSLVSGGGAKSLTVAYGVNRADWAYQPGGVVSGPALILPNYPELLDPFPWLWQQKEYVIGGAATYIFSVLAVDQLYAEKKGDRAIGD